MSAAGLPTGPEPAPRPCPLCACTWLEHVPDSRTGALVARCDRCRVLLDRDPVPRASWAESAEHLLELLDTRDFDDIGRWRRRHDDNDVLRVILEGDRLLLHTYPFADPPQAITFPLELSGLWLVLVELETHGKTAEELDLGDELDWGPEVSDE